MNEKFLILEISAISKFLNSLPYVGWWLIVTTVEFIIVTEIGCKMVFQLKILNNNRIGTVVC